MFTTTSPRTTASAVPPSTSVRMNTRWRVTPQATEMSASPMSSARYCPRIGSSRVAWARLPSVYRGRPLVTHVIRDIQRALDLPPGAELDGFSKGTSRIRRRPFHLTSIPHTASIDVSLAHPWLNWIEHLTTDQEVRGSNPCGCAIFCQGFRCRRDPWFVSAAR